MLLTYLVSLDNFAEILETLRVLVIRPHKHALLASRHSKRPNAGHDVGYDIARLKQSSDALVLRAEFRVPVDLGVVEFEAAACFANFDQHVVGAGEDFVREGAEFALGADIVCFVDDGADVGVLVDDDLGDDGFVREILAAEVEVSWGY